MKKTKLLWYLLTFIPIALIILGYIFPIHFFGSQEAIREFVMRFGALAPLAFILLQILQVIFTPISHYTVSIAGGFIFGTWNGFIYNWIGRIIGTAIAFYLGKTVGRKLFGKLVSAKTVEKYDFYFDKGKILLFLGYVLPFFPDDEFGYLAGISALKSRFFLPMMMLGHVIGSLALAYIGSGITSTKDPLFIILSVITIISGTWFIFHYRTVKNQNSKKK